MTAPGVKRQRRRPPPRPALRLPRASSSRHRQSPMRGWEGRTRSRRPAGPAASLLASAGADSRRYGDLLRSRRATSAVAGWRSRSGDAPAPGGRLLRKPGLTRSPACLLGGAVAQAFAGRRCRSWHHPRRGRRELNTVQPLVVPTITFPLPSIATHRPLGVHDTPVSELASTKEGGGEE